MKELINNFFNRNFNFLNRSFQIEIKKQKEDKSFVLEKLVAQILFSIACYFLTGLSFN